MLEGADLTIVGMPKAVVDNTLGGKPSEDPMGHYVYSRVIFIRDYVGQYQETTSLKMSLTLSARRPLTNCSWSGSYYFAARLNSRKLVDRILPLVVSNNRVDQFSANRPGCKTRLATLGLICCKTKTNCNEFVLE